MEQLINSYNSWSAPALLIIVVIAVVVVFIEYFSRR